MNAERLSRRNFLALSAGAGLAICAGCGASPPAAPAQPGTTGGLSGSITAWMPASCYFCGAADLWNERHPDTPVEVIMAGAGTEGAEVTAKWQAALRTGQGGTDIYQSQPSQIPKNMLHQQLYDWTDRIEPIRDKLVPFKLRECTHPKTGRVYGIPFQLGVVGAYYREDLLQEVGYTHDMLDDLSWDEYVELGRKLKQDKGIYLDYGTPSSTVFFQNLLWLAGGSFTNQDGTEITIDNEIAIDVMNKIKVLYDEDLMAPMDAASAPFYTALREGQVAILWNATWFGGYFHANLAEGDDGFGQWRNVRLPYLVEGGPRTVNRGGSPLESPAFTANPDLTWAVLEFAMGTVEGAMAMMRLGTVVSNIEALQTQEFKETTWPYAGDWHMNELWAEYAADVPNTFYFTPVFDEAVTILANHQPQILRGEVSVEEGLQAAAEEIGRANETYVRIMEQE